MKADIKKKWVAALRSGEYLQAYSKLRSGARYCCLGVLCDLYAKDTGRGSWIGDHFAVNTVHYNLALPREVQSWAEVHNGVIDCGTDTGFGEKVWACTLNDMHKKSFAEIADIVEKATTGDLKETQ
jgi:hypothetical protein